jgi:hypothetical protein
MSSSRSAASVRAKRAGPQQEQTFGRASGPGPVTSIGSTQIFNAGGNTTGANARIHGSGVNASVKSAPLSRETNDLSNPAPGSKISVNGAIALIAVRLGRLESFMHQYNLEDRGASLNTESMQPILTRLSDLEYTVAGMKTQVQTQTQTQTHKSSKDTEGSNLLLLTRINALEKQVSASSNSSSAPSVQPGLFNGLKTEVEGVKNSVNTFSEEMKELKDMLLRLQTYTMQTNAKLVNAVLPLYENVNVQEFEEMNGDNNGDVGGDFLYAQEVDDLCYSEDQDQDQDQHQDRDRDQDQDQQDYVGVNVAEETNRLNGGSVGSNKNGISIIYNENSTTFTPNLKELINQELMNCSRF